MQKHRMSWIPARKYRWVLALSIGVLLSFAPLGFLSAYIPVASAHALPVRTDPASDAILNVPPQQVHIWFSEELIPQTSHLLVVDTTNREVDNKDSTVSNDGIEMSVTLPLLPSGTYVVVWRSQSAFDGHIAAGSFLFRIARPDGTVPPIPLVLPTGNVPGAAGNGIVGSTNLDAYTLLQTVMTWFALLFMTFWVGGVIWETWILPSGEQQDPDLAEASTLASRRFGRMAPVAVVLIILADLGIVMGQAAELAGDWLGAVSLPLLHVILFQSHFGMFWWMREGGALLILLLILVASRRGWSAGHSFPKGEEQKEAFVDEAVHPEDEVLALPNWWASVGESIREIRFVPRRLVTGWQGRTGYGKVELLLAAGLLLAFALSGHAAAVPTYQLWYALSSDILHLVGTTVWVGGLFSIAVVLVPTLFKLDTRRRARVLALGLPEFSALALMTFLLLAATGSLNTTVHLTSLDQLVTTLYGRTLTVKICLFLLMAVISAHHAFTLRSRVVLQLQSPDDPADSAKTVGEEPATTHEHTHQEHIPPLWSLRRLTERMADWLQIEALIGVAILLCVVFLSAFAGTLAVSPTASPATTTASSDNQAHGPFLQTQHGSGYTISLEVTPDSFGTNTFTVKVQDAQHHPVKGAAILIETQMLDMDMGTDTTQLQAVAATPGSYSGQSDLTMAGHWRLVVRLLPPNKNTFVLYSFNFSAV